MLLWADGNDLWFHGEAGVTNARFGLRDSIEGISSVVGVTILLGQLTPYNARNDEFIEPHSFYPSYPCEVLECILKI